MQNSQPVGNPHEHFASLWKGQATEGQQPADSYSEMWGMVERLANDVQLLQRGQNPSSSFEGLGSDFSFMETSPDDFQNCWRACGECTGIELSDHPSTKKPEDETRHDV